MAVAILLATVAAVGWGGADFLGGLSRGRTSVFGILAVSELIGAALVVPILVATGLPHWNPRLLLGCAAGIGVTVELSIVYYALSVGAAFITAPVGALGTALAVTVGLLGGDPLGPGIAIGLVCTILGSRISAGDGNGNGGHPLSQARLITGCATAAIGVASMQITLHAAGKVDPYWATGLEHITTAASAFLIALVTAHRNLSSPSHDGRDNRSVPQRAQLPMLTLVAAAGVAGDVAYAAASAGPLSTVSAIASLYPIPTIALGLVVQHRRPTTLQAAGISLALVGAAVLGAATG